MTSRCWNVEETKILRELVAGPSGTQNEIFDFHDRDYSNYGATSGHLIADYADIIRRGFKGIPGAMKTAAMMPVELALGNGLGISECYQRTSRNQPFDNTVTDAPQTGDPCRMETFEEFFEAFSKQLTHIIEKIITLYNKTDYIRGTYAPPPYVFCLVRSCAESGAVYVSSDLIEKSFRARSCIPTTCTGIFSGLIPM